MASPSPEIIRLLSTFAVAFSVPTQGYRKVVEIESAVTEVKIPELLAHFSDLPDPRKARGIRHELSDIVVLSILAVICGANTPFGAQAATARFISMVWRKKTQ
jgi:hypothetical protein